MELETLFTTSKWEILGKISQRPASPLQLSAQLSTTIANISQQIRLLDVAGLLDKKKISTRESGKPRTLFSVKDDFSYLILVSAEGAKKGLIKVSRSKRLIMNAWLSKEQETESIAYRVHEQLADQLGSVSAVVHHRKKRELIIVSDSQKELARDIERLRKSVSGLTQKVRTMDTKEFVSYLRALQVTDINDLFTVLLLDHDITGRLQRSGKEERET
ncbi:MAG: hypothetical protein GXP63_01740 [DPANN group archaeon]|nr:hypothetical protein [DPANN group archaeon]